MLRDKRSKLSPALVGLFLFAFLTIYSLYVPLPSLKNPIVFYNSEKRVDLNLVLKKSISKAKKSITLRSYSVTDIALLSLLKKRAAEGLSIHLYYDKKATPSLEVLEEKNFHFHPIQGKGLIHEKIWIIDEILLFVGSTNLTPSSLNMHDNLMVGLYAPSLARKISKGRPQQMHLETEKAIFHYYSLPNDNGIKALLDTLEQAKKTVSLSLFTFTHPQIGEKLIELHKRGIKIRVKLDRGTASGASKNIKKRLENAGIDVQTSQGFQLFHHKWAVIDQKTHIIGSANWTKAAFKKNHDFILIIDLATKRNA